MHKMPRPTSGRLLTATLVLALALAACSSAASSGTPPSLASGASASAATEPTIAAAGPTAAPAAPPSLPITTPQLPAFHLVLIGDSVFNGVGYAATQMIGPKLGVTVAVADWINPDLAKYASGGERAADLLVRLRTDQALRSDLRAADAIWFDVPMGLALDVCGAPADVSRATFEACLPTFLSQYAKDVDGVMGQIVALRPPTQAVIRVLTVWQLFLPTFRAAGTVDLAVRQWQQMRTDVTRAAVLHRIGVVDTYRLFSGSDGLRDSMGAGDVLSDEVHLTGQGVERLVELFVASGLAPMKS